MDRPPSGRVSGWTASVDLRFAGLPYPFSSAGAVARLDSYLPAAGAKVDPRILAGTPAMSELPTLPTHVGFDRHITDWRSCPFPRVSVQKPTGVGHQLPGGIEMANLM